MENTTIAAISTPEAAGAIGTVRISGEDALIIADRIFRPVSGAALTESAGYRAHYGKVVDGEKEIDEGVCLVFRAPHSYTGENTAEITCHGGLYITRAVLRAALGAGAVPAQAGEFTKRAFLNGKIDLAESEAVMSLISAQGAEAAKAALNTLDGRLSEKIHSAASLITGVLASLSAWVDYPYDEIEDTTPDEILPVFRQASAQIKEIVDRYDSGRVYTEGVDTAIVGRPNVGKSTLMNLLSGCERSIVTDVAGTTRDVVEQSVRLGSLILRAADTAGIHETSDSVESIGVERAKKRMKNAQLILAVFDSSEELNADDMGILSECDGRLSIAVINKTDLPAKADENEIAKHVSECVKICASSGEGERDLENAVSRLLCTENFNPDNACLASERQRDCCIKALGFIDEAVAALESAVTLDAVTVCAQCAVDALLELTGEKAADAVIDEVFSRFCVGK